MKDLTLETVREGLLLHYDESSSENQEYTDEVLNTIRLVLELEESEMLARVHQLTKGHIGRHFVYVEGDRLVEGTLTDVEVFSKSDDRGRWNDDRVLSIDGKIERVRTRGIVKITKEVAN